MPSKFVNYIGPSMNPAFKAGDGLMVFPYEGKKIRAGDVIVFPHPELEHLVVHRVVKVSAQQISTRGDNNDSIDLRTIPAQQVIGRVVYAQRRNIKRRVWGGCIGQLFAGSWQLLRRIDKMVSPLLRPAYHCLSRRGFFRALKGRVTAIKIFSYHRAEGLELQLLIGRRLIGRLSPRNKKWHIHRPFRIFVAEGSLSREDSTHSIPQ